ncbi:MAG TPA: integrase, partial [Gammaproteobacteria bacterium]|nr:integrase [Gammaproteobacteria bacterium]
PSMFEQELSGVTFENKEERAKSKRALARGLKTKELLTQRFKAWEAEYRKRGCI